MNLVAYISGATVAGYKLDDLRDILTYSHSNLNIISQGTGLLIVSDGNLIKCVSNYYEGPDEIKKPRSSSNQCHEVQKAFGVSRSVQTNCVACHLDCMNRVQAETGLRFK